MYDNMDEAVNCPRGDIELVEDEITGVISNFAFRPELMTYDGHYQNEQALSPQFRLHLQEVADVVERDMGLSRLVEVGCGKGSFLELLQARGADITGFDVTYEGNNPSIQRKLFSAEVTVQADALILRHVLEHIKDPFSFLHQLKEANGGRGRIYIEVPCFDWICERRAWFDIFYEHVNYFRLSDFFRFFGEVVSCGHLFGEQYFYVVADLGLLRQCPLPVVSGFSLPNDFTCAIAKRRSGDQGCAVVWGGASKGVIFSLLRARAGYPVDKVIDINPEKQRRFLPGTGLMVHAPEQVLPELPKGSSIYVMNSNYLQEIRSMAGEDFIYIGVDHE
ncbi:class I SAM-dependent methyltransferase [Pseudomonas sp. zfem001]|uniref:class I SAM-dependent methyltransferase n=1 Tax=Pseudomonas sp. zfem001 TaxID=3078196 RepID=UPI0029286C05|nr:class I SAM-dependent methyltransferase [Pseudomonas sp. zfem001]MDU9410212.1 class I SAM-dependent methyltransferase [Pseudomonas sp. zfem001]